MNEQTIEKLKDMRLSGFIAGLLEQSESATYSDLSFDERLAFLVDKEHLMRKNSRIERAIKTAKLKLSATIEDIDFNQKRNIKKIQILDLATCNWISKQQNLILTGPTGIGKSFIACAFGDKACKLGFKVYYAKLNEIIREILLAHAEGIYPKFVVKLAKFHLLIIDEWMRDPLCQEHAREILDLIDDRYQKASIVFCSQMPVANWHQNIQDPTIADAILDRIIHNSHRIKLSGESLRRKGEPSLRSDL